MKEPRVPIDPDAEVSLTLSEISGVMCEVAREPNWRRGRRGFATCDKNLYGIKLEVRSKGDVFKLFAETWNINFIRQERGGYTINLPIFDDSKERVPVVSTVNGRSRVHHQMVKRDPRTIVRMTGVSMPEVVVTDFERFMKDWTLLRMFSSLWTESA